MNGRDYNYDEARASIDVHDILVKELTDHMKSFSRINERVREVADSPGFMTAKNMALAGKPREQVRQAVKNAIMAVEDS